jgi:hypothetical protein
MKDILPDMHQKGKLNYVDFIFLVWEDIVPSQSQLIPIRFTSTVDSHAIRNATRYLLSIYPRLRSIVEPGRFCHHLLIYRDDDPELEALFDRAFRVKHNLQ